MKVKLFLVIVLVAAFMAIVAGGVAAAPSLNYTSCFQVQNLDTSNAANIVIEYYEQGTAAPVAMPSDTISAGNSVTYCPLSAVPSGFNGSVVISSNRQVAAIANVSGSNGGTPDFSAYNASYSGFTGGATTVSLPLLFDNNFGYDTWFNVQNTGGGTATVNVSYSDGSSAGPVMIGAGQSATFDQASESHTQAVFAGTITSNEPVVATVIEVGPTSAPMLFGYNGFTAGSTNPSMPLVQANNYGFTTGIQIQNTGGSSSNVTVSYTPTSAVAQCEGGNCGSACTESHNIAAGASETFALSSCISSQATFVGSAEVTTNSGGTDLVAIVNQHNFNTNKGASYGGFNTSSASDTVVMPLIFDSHYGYFSGFNVVNVGGTTTNVNCTFSGDSRTVGGSLTPGSALTDVQLGVMTDPDPGPAGYVGAATCTASGGADNMIVGVVNELLNAGTADTLLTYEGTNN